jgi:hypothetical protein
MKPHLTRQQVESLKDYCKIEDVEPAQVYGDPIGTVAGGWDVDWLEATVMAGYVPHIEALPLAVRAYQVWIRATAAEALADEADADAISWVEGAAEDYRALIAVLEELVAENEYWLAGQYRTPPFPADPALRAMWADDALAAEHRATAAHARRKASVSDSRNAGAMRERYEPLPRQRAT